MENIDLARFSQAIRRQYPGITSEMADGYARLWERRIDPLCTEALSCWIREEALPEVRFQDMTLQQILAIRGDNDALQAILLMSDYIRDPSAGMRKILRPRR